MKYVTNKLHLEYDELVPDVMPKGTYDSLKSRGKLVVIGIGGNGRNVLVEYERMPDEYRDKVRQIYGDPYQYAAKQPILDAIMPNQEARQFYLNYVLPCGAKLPATDTDVMGRRQINYVNRYTENAEWLDMLVKLTTDKRTLKDELTMSILQFWDVAAELVRVKKVALPGNARRLKDKTKEYQKGGFEALVEKHKFGNVNAEKVCDEEAKALLLKLLCHGNDFEDTQVADLYNKWALENGRDAIHPATVGYRRKQWRAQIILEREGAQKTSSLLSKQIKRDRASAPLLLVNSDDNVLDAYFVRGREQWYRPVLYVVIDTFNDYILGYAWGDNVTKDLIKEAYRNAHRHVMKMTGAAYSWQQLQTDRWGISGKNTTDLEEFFNSMGTFVPAALKNAQSKYIERSFGTVWHQTLKGVFLNNYSGHNVTAKSQINREALETRNFPDIADADIMIEAFVWAMRMTKRTGSDLTRHDEWLQAFQQSEKSKKKLLSDEERLLVFGLKHSETNQIKASGLTPTLGGKRRTYELSQAQIFEHVGKSVQVYYDPEDLGKVLVTDGRGVRFMAHEYGRVPGAFADYEPGDGERIKALQDEKRTLLPMINSTLEKRDAILERARIDAESLIQAGVMRKDLAIKAQRVLTGSLPELSQEHAENNTEEGGVDAELVELETLEKPLKTSKPAKKSIYDLM
jgi:hypothetical protein